MAEASPLPSLEVDTVYDVWKLEVEVWQALTELPQNKQGLKLFTAISTDHPLGIRNKVLKDLGPAKLKADDGVDLLIAFLDSFFEGVEPQDERKATEESSEVISSKDSEESEVSEKDEESEQSEEEITQDVQVATTVKRIKKLNFAKPSIDEEVDTTSPTTKRQEQSLQEGIRRQKLDSSGVKKTQKITKEAEHIAGKSTKKTVSKLSSAMTEGGEAAEEFFRGEEIPEILLSVLTERLAETFGNKGPLQLAGVVLSTLAMSEIGMLLGIISNPLTFDPYKLAQMKQMEMLKSIDKKLDKIIREPLTSAMEKLSDVFDTLKDCEWEDARAELDNVSTLAQKAKNYDLPFPLLAQAVKIYTFAEIMKLQYDSGAKNRDETGNPVPFFRPTFKLKKLKKEKIQKKLQAAVDELKKVALKERSYFGQRVEKIREEYQNVIDGLLKEQYSVMSVCRDFTNPTRMLDAKIEFKLATDFLPHGENDSTALSLGILGKTNKKEQETLVCWVWRDADHAFLRIGMRKFTLALKHARNMEIPVQLTKTTKGYDCRYGYGYGGDMARAQPENGILPPNMKKVKELVKEAKNARSVTDLSLEAYQAAGSISPDYLMFLEIDFSQKDRTDDDQNTLLHYIVQTPCSRGQKEKAKTVIETIVNGGGEGVLTKQNARGMTPMMICLEKKQRCMPMLEILLEMVQRDEKKDLNDNSIVHYAAISLDDKDIEPMKRILDKHGDFLDCHNIAGESPFDVANKYNPRSPKIKELLRVVA